MIVTQTPLRVSLAGGGTDLCSYYRHRAGRVVSTAIDKAVFVIVTARYDDKIYVNYSHKEIVDHVDDVQHELVREAMKMTGVEHGVEVTMLSDIPSEGSGLGSSSSFTVGLLNAFHTYAGDPVAPAQLAEEACEIEIERCNKPIGKQDQYIAAFGGIRAFEFRPDGSVGEERIRLADAQVRQFSERLFLYYSNQVRKSADILFEQNRRTPENLECLDGIRDLASEARAALRDGNFDDVGRILNDGWRRKKGLASRVTNDCLNEMHATATSAGASGAKICGAGGGGFLLAYVRREARESVLNAMAGYRRMPLNLEPDGSKVIFNYRRAGWA